MTIIMINFQNKQEDIYSTLDAYYAPATTEDEIYSQLKTCGTNSIHHDQIRLISTYTLHIRTYLISGVFLLES